MAQRPHFIPKAQSRLPRLHSDWRPVWTSIVMTTAMLSTLNTAIGQSAMPPASLPVPLQANPSSSKSLAPDQLTQVSVINALMLGQFRGTMTLGELLKFGDLGLGTVDHLDGELIILNGIAYQAKSDGTVHPCPPTMTTPFAAITPFEGESTLTCPAIRSLEHLEAYLEPHLPSRDMFVAIRIDAKFTAVSLRAVPRQEPPYQPLAEVVKVQAQWKRENIEGTLIGIRCPKWVTGISVPGYHWHFLSKDRQSGGHVFNCQFETAEAAFDRCRTWTIKLDQSFETSEKDLSQDLSKELEQVERQREPVQGGKPAPASAVK